MYFLLGLHQNTEAVDEWLSTPYDSIARRTTFNSNSLK